MSAGVFVCDISSLHSFKKAIEFHKEFTFYLSSSRHKTIPVAFICIKNNTTEVPLEKVRSFAEIYEIDYYELEKEDLGTFDKVLHGLIKEIFKNLPLKESTTSSRRPSV